jgi:hypothetical protein
MSKPEYKVEFTKTASGLKGYAVVNSKGKQVYFDESKADAEAECEVQNAKHAQKKQKKESRAFVATRMAEAFIQSKVKDDFKKVPIVSIHTFKDKQGGIRVAEISVWQNGKNGSGGGYSWMRCDATSAGAIILAVEDFILTYDVKAYRPKGWESDIDEHADAEYKLGILIDDSKTE